MQPNNTKNNAVDKPMWLELRKEYIDDSFEKLIMYLKAVKKDNQDSFYATTISLMKERVIDMVANIGSEQIYEQSSEDANVYPIRLLSAYLLIDKDSDTAFSVFIALFKLLLQDSKPQDYEAVIALIHNRLKYTKCDKLGYLWSDIEDYKDEIFLYKVTRFMTFTQERTDNLFYANHGTAAITNDGLLILPSNIDEVQKLLENGVNSLDTQIGSSLRTSKTDKLKQQDSNNLDEIEIYLKNIIANFRKITFKEKKNTKLLSYANGDKVEAKITMIRNGIIYLETVDKRYEKITGVLKSKHSNIFYYDYKLFAKNLKEGDLLMTTITDVEKGEFSIKDEFIKFCVEYCRNSYGYGTTIAKLFKRNNNTDLWINNCGTPIYSKISNSYQKNDYVVLQITKYCEGDGYGKIESEIIDRANENEEFDIDDQMSFCIEDFAKSAHGDESKEEKSVSSFDPVILRILAAIYFKYQMYLHRPIERTYLLANARLMEAVVGDEHQESFLKFTSDYLRTLVKFTMGENIKDIDLMPDASYAEAEATKTRLKIVELLKEYGKEENSEVLSNCIEEYETENPMLSRIARLIQTSNTLQELLSNSAMNVIKREIIKSLSLETENDADLEGEDNRYLGVENSTVEFKTSMVYPPDNNMQPDVQTQTNNVFRAVCAFLNSTIGGTVYLGVNDMGYVCGLKNDFTYFNCKNLDTYTRIYIQDKLIEKFGLDVMTHIQITPMFEGDVVAIKVESHPYRIVELDKIAYIRVNNESREMTESVRRDILSKKIVSEKDAAAKISNLQHAMSDGKCVKLHNYASSHSGSVTDRKVEPYNVLPHEGIAICLDHKDNKSKVFVISRMGSVEILDEAWKYKNQHKKISVDAFHMTGDKPIKVSWSMDLFAKNLLLEEYPSSKKDIHPDKNDEDTWYFDTEVYQIQGIARFYVGLAEHINIIKAPELVEYIKTYKEKL